MGRSSSAAKPNRREEILAACETLYQTMGFRDVTLKEIAACTSFSRPSIYNYFETKEEIFLAIFQREYDLWRADMEAAMEQPGALTRAQVADLLARTVSARPLLLRLLSMNLYDMEEHSRPDRLAEFKRSFGASIQTVDRLLCRFCPDMTEGDRQDFLYVFFPFLYGVYPYTTVTEKQRQAMEAAGASFWHVTAYDLVYCCAQKLLAKQEIPAGGTLPSQT